MIQQLQAVYPSIIPFQKNMTTDYIWFITNEGDIFGILEEELTEKDYQVLLAFCTLYRPLLPAPGPKEQAWQKDIFTENPGVAENPFRFIYFTLPENQIDPSRFQEALHTLFDEALPIFWETETEGILIEEMTALEEVIQFEQIIPILTADVSANLRFFVGPLLHHFQQAATLYQTIIETGRKVIPASRKDVIHYHEAIPFQLVQQLPEQNRKQVISTVLHEFQHDEEMLHILQAFFKHHLNISETAKKLYMHRNSLQYRIDKFTKTTGIRVQDFPEAVLVQLALYMTIGIQDVE